MRNLTLSTLLSCAIALTACGSDDNAMTQQFTELLTRPALEEVLEQYKQMRQEIADELTTAFGLLEWTVNESTGGGSLCGQEFIDLGVDARNERPPLLSTTTSIPDAQWDQAVQIAEKIARKNGFGAPQHVVDRTGQHTVDFRDKWGGLLGMDSGVNAVLSVDTGCHLTEEAHRRGTPTPLPEHNR